MEFMNNKWPEWLTNINSVISIVGFIVNVVVFLQVASIRRSFSARARLPELIGDLTKSASELSASLNGWPNTCLDVRTQLKVAESTIKTAKRVLPRDVRGSLGPLYKGLKAIAKSVSPTTDVDKIWSCYSEMLGAITSMEQHLKNIKWK
jgi:hypothetical protein